MSHTVKKKPIPKECFFCQDRFALLLHTYQPASNVSAYVCAKCLATLGEAGTRVGNLFMPMKSGTP